MNEQLLQQWIKLSTKLDAMTLRERAMVFGAVTAAILFVIYTVAVEPMMVRQKLLLAQIKQQQNQVAGIDAEIAAKAQTFTLDPDAEARKRLLSMRQDIDRTSADLLAVQKGLVAPERIAPLLEQLLRGNGKLKLMAMKTLPVTGMNEAMPPPSAPATASAADAANAANAGAANAAAAPTVAPAAAVATPGAPAAPTLRPRELLYRHGVEIVLQGSYIDMVNYMAALEALPVQLFWGNARLEAQQYPNSRLTLTLYTLSLDTKWMKL